MTARSQVHWMTEVGMFFEKSGPVWDTLHALEHDLQEASIDYAVIGGMALNAHNYPRQTVDVDLVLRPVDFEKFKERFEGTRYIRRPDSPRRFVDPRTEVSIDVLVAGELAGNKKKNRTVRFPDPSEAEVHRNIRTVSLARLIELKLVTWRFKDWGDVVELIRRNKLPESLTDKLDPVTRSAYRQCFDQANDSEYDGS
jgi:hypothetical protein